MSTYHTPVLLRETIEGLDVRTGEKYIDATVGDGGHTEEIAKRGGIVLGLDADESAIARAGTRLRDKKVVLVHANFRDLETVAEHEGFGEVRGILFDLGVSSDQLDNPQQGFSFRSPEALLDLRFDKSRGETAAALVNRLSSEELYEIFTEFGEEERARSIVRAVVLARKLAPIRTTGDLAGSVAAAIPNPIQMPRSLARIFQGLRIAVNDELDALHAGLVSSERLLMHGGRLAVISFHSLEDRIVKQCMRKLSWMTVNKKPVRPDDDEIRANPRSRSAKLRTAIKI
jgi:16S rRNA (cytosine1402-N4)-methyltransferase